MARQRVLLLLLLLAIVTTTPGLGRPVISRRNTSGACVDDFDGLVEFMAQNDISSNGNDLEGCGDAVPYCENNGQPGRLARSYCCKTCAGEGGSGSGSDTNKGNNNGNSSSSSNNNSNNGNNGNNFSVTSILPPSDKPVDLFLLAGQSECKGAAQSGDLYEEGGGKSKYPKLQGSIDGVWFAGYRGTAAPEQFLIKPMSARVGRSTFGPEVSFGERIYAATGGSRNVVIVKYCAGGTNVRSHWNPDKVANSWNEKQDDGTSAFLESRTEFETKTLVKTHQFVNSIYTARRTEEALDAAGISYRWAGIVWVQGNADSMPIGDEPVWKTFGENTARVWEGFRRHLGSTVPIVDNGSSAQNQLKSGKEYAISILEGGLAYNVEYGFTASDDTGTCKVGPKNPCVGASGWFVEPRILDLFGIDPNMLGDPNVDKLLVDNTAGGGEDRVFSWFVDYPTNVHSAYDGMVLNGRMLANAYLRQFRDPTEYDLTPYSATDAEVRFPFDRCPDGVVASPGNICWIDYRPADVPTLAPATFPLIPTASPVGATATPEKTARPTGMPRPTGFPSAPTAPPVLRPTVILPPTDGEGVRADYPATNTTTNNTTDDAQVVLDAEPSEQPASLTSGLRTASSSAAAPLAGSISPRGKAAWMVWIAVAVVGISAFA